MTKTLQELETEAFSILTGMDPTSSPSAEDLATIEVYVDPLLEGLASRRVAYIADRDDIPDDAFLPLARLLANVCGPRFGSAMNADAKKVDEAELREMNWVWPTFEPMEGYYF